MEVDYNKRLEEKINIDEIIDEQYKEGKLSECESIFLKNLNNIYLQYPGCKSKYVKNRPR